MNQTPNDAPNVTSQAFVVGDLRVDIGQQRVMRSGAEITLPNLSFQLLVALIRAAPNVVSHDFLMARVWPGLVVSPETVNKRANLLREALGDDAREPRYIAGVRSRGYRLVAEITPVERQVAPPAALAPNAVPATPDIESSMPDIVTSEATIASTTQSPKRWLGIGLIAVVVLAVGVVARTTIRAHSASSSIPAAPPQGIDAPIDTRARTVAVLPFETISADAADAYLARGLPEMVLNRLSRVTGLTVIARSSSFALSTARLDSPEIGRRLNAGFLVNGSVQRKAERLRVTVQLVDSSAGTLIWSVNFDRALKDIFTLEDEIADQVTSALSARLGGLDSRPVAQAGTGNVEAYLAYLRGRALLGRFSVAETESAAPYFEKAIALDPNFAAAYASLYDSRLQAAQLRDEDLAPVRERFRPLIDRALTIDPNSGTAYFARAMWADAAFEARNADFIKGVALDPSNGRGLTAYAEFLDNEDFGWVQGGGSSGNYPVQREAAKRILQRALQVDPISPGAHFDAATGDLEEGGAAMIEQKMQSVLELDPDFVPALFQVGKYRWAFHGQLADAVQILEHAITLDPRNPVPRNIAMHVYLDLGDEQAARAVVAGMPQSSREPLLLLLYAGDWRAAGRAAYDYPDGHYDICSHSLAVEALRDYALKTGELSRAIALIKADSYFEGNPAAHLEVCNISEVTVLSHLLTAQGQTAEAQKLRRATVAWNDANTAKFGGGMRRIAAVALLLDGRKEAALDKLAEDFRAGDYQFWWYTLTNDPVWLPLHGDPRFQAIAADVQRYVDAQRRALEELRRRGVVPPASRPGDRAPKPEIQ